MIAKNLKSIFPLYAKTFSRKMFGFMTFGELSRMEKKNGNVRQTQPRVSLGNHVEQFLKEKKEQTLKENISQIRVVVNNGQ